jgi:hypothetical protein
MNETTVAVAQIAPRDALLPSTTQWNLMRDEAAVLLKSGFLPDSIKTAEQALTIMLKGRELGIAPMRALENINVIKGRTSTSAELQLSMIYENIPGARVEFPVYNHDAVTVRGSRPGHKPLSITWTIEDASRAALLGKDSWKKFPRAMLRSRAISELARAMFPDGIAGLSYTHEELGADVDEEGHVVEGAVPVETEREQLRNDLKALKAEAEKPAEATPADAERDTPPTEDELQVLYAAVNQAGWTKQEAQDVQRDVFGVETSKDLLRKDYVLFLESLGRGLTPQQMIDEARFNTN